MRKQRNDYNLEFARSLYRLRQAGLSNNDIALNPNYNTKGITLQRISKIISEFTKRLAEGKVTLDDNN